MHAFSLALSYALHEFGSSISSFFRPIVCLPMKQLTMTRKSSTNLRLFRRYLANTSSLSISQETLEEDVEYQFDQGSRIIMNNRNTTPILGRRSRSMNRSVDSTDSSNSSGTIKIF